MTEQTTENLALFDATIFDDLQWADDAAIAVERFDDSAHHLEPQYCVLPVEHLTNLFSVHSWYALGRLYGITQSEFLVNPTATIAAIRDRVLESPLTLVDENQVCLACKVNPIKGLTQQWRGSDREGFNLDKRDRVVVQISKPSEGILDGRGIKGRKHRKSSFLRKASQLEASPVDEGLSPQHLIVSRGLQLLIQPVNVKGCSILAKIAYRNRPTYASDRTFQPIGVLRLDAKRILWSCSNEELGRIQPDIRLRLLTMCKEIGLIPNTHIKDANKPGKGSRTAFYGEAMQDHLKVSFEIPANPCNPYTLIADKRDRRMPETQTSFVDSKAKRKHAQIARYTTDSAKDAAIDSLFNRAVNAERKLKAETAIADSLYQDVRTLEIAITSPTR